MLIDIQIREKINYSQWDVPCVISWSIYSTVITKTQVIQPEWQINTAFDFALNSFKHKIGYVLLPVNEHIVIQIKNLTAVTY